MRDRDKIVVDIGRIMDEVFEAAQNLQDAVHEGLNSSAKKGEKIFSWDENLDLYPSYTYPPVNVFIDEDKCLTFEFALAGFNENNISLEFSGDHMLFSAKVDKRFSKQEDVKYLKHRLKFKDVEEQKYYVPADKFEQTKVDATYSAGILTVMIPPKPEEKTKESIRVSIKKE